MIFMMPLVSDRIILIVGWPVVLICTSSSARELVLLGRYFLNRTHRVIQYRIRGV